METPTASLGSLGQGSVTLRGKKFFLIFSWNFLCFSLCPLPLAPGGPFFMPNHGKPLFSSRYLPFQRAKSHGNADQENPRTWLHVLGTAPAHIPRTNTLERPWLCTPRKGWCFPSSDRRDEGREIQGDFLPRFSFAPPHAQPRAGHAPQPITPHAGTPGAGFTRR